MSAHTTLKDHTAAAHAVVDAAFSHFDLGERGRNRLFSGLSFGSARAW
jgi:hypothetical protein